MGKFSQMISIKELKATPIWKALLAEFHGNFLLNFFGCASTATGNHVLIALTFGFTIAAVIQSVGHVSGGLINPAVTVGMVAAGKMGLLKALLYIVTQTLGAVAGSAMVKVLINSQTPLGVTLCAPGITEIQGFGIEFFLGFILVLTVMGICDGNNPVVKSTAGLSIGFAVVLGHLSALQYTGASMNPARSFGAALMAGNWENQWIYWAGPILGGIAASLLYDYVFASPVLVTVDNKERKGVCEDKEMKPLDTVSIDLKGDV